MLPRQRENRLDDRLIEELSLMSPPMLSASSALRIPSAASQS
jgi:hypothetical protein